MVITGCGGPKPAEPAAKDTKPAPIVMKIGHVTSPYGSRQNAAVDLVKRLDVATNGRLKVEVYPAAQLGDNATLIQAVQTGTVQGVITPTLFTFSFHEMFNVLDLPYLFPDMDTAMKVTQSKVGDELLGSVGIGTRYCGRFRTNPLPNPIEGRIRRRI